MITRIVRLILILGALPVGWFGLSLLWDMSAADKISIAVWLIAGLVAHDAVFAPACIAAGHGVKAVLPQRLWPPVLAGTSATLLLLLLALPVLYPRSASQAAPGNDESGTILDRPYGLGLTVAVLITWALVIVLIVRGRASSPSLHDKE
ncbi:hypothetical protein [uncultured Williamsia sp.]|uniref:hypothetical protein n=1 Tax=uncultured Williamsia sp. TaxID=259311 RepID=UPI00261F0D42|nr:hypothetical protein [uncultured Williamsia sp.]